MRLLLRLLQLRPDVVVAADAAVLLLKAAAPEQVAAVVLVARRRKDEVPVVVAVAVLLPKDAVKLPALAVQVDAAAPLPRLQSHRRNWRMAFISSPADIEASRSR